MSDARMYRHITEQEREHLPIDLCKWARREMTSADFMVKWAERIEHDQRSKLPS